MWGSSTVGHLRCIYVFILYFSTYHSPDDTVWEGGTFNLLIEFSEDYPNKAPKVRFVSKLFHPNVYADGESLRPSSLFMMY